MCNHFANNMYAYHNDGSISSSRFHNILGFLLARVNNCIATSNCHFCYKSCYYVTMYAHKQPTIQIQMFYST